MSSAPVELETHIQAGPVADASVVGAEDLPLVVYSPESALRRPRAMIGEMLRDVRNSRELAWRLFVRDIRAQYRQSLLGYVWMLLPPLASMLMFAFLQSQNILNVGRTDIPYPAYVLTGTVLWEVFTASIWAPLGAVSGAASMLTKLNFPREALLLTAIYHVLFNVGIKLPLLVPVFWWFQVPVTAAVLLSPLGILSLLVFGFTLGLLLVPIGLLYQDVGRALGMLMAAWFLVTPVIYPPPTVWPGVLITRVNPVSPLLITARDLLTGGQMTHWLASIVLTVVSLIVLLFAWVAYRLAMPHLVARMSA